MAQTAVTDAFDPAGEPDRSDDQPAETADRGGDPGQFDGVLLELTRPALRPDGGEFFGQAGRVD